MPYIMNCLDDSVSTQVNGKWFSFKPHEIKMFHNEHIARFMAQNRGEEGLVEVPEQLVEMDKNSTDYKKEIYEIRKSGIAKFIEKQNMIIRNLEISLRGDYERSGQKGNFLFNASKGELQAYKNLKKYREYEVREQLNVADEIQKVREELFGGESHRPSPSEGAPAPVNHLKKA